MLRKIARTLSMATPRTASLVLALAALPGCGGDRGDPDFDTSVAKPAYEGEHPKVAFDEGHREHHKSRGTYYPLAQLVRHDGYDVERIDDPLTEKLLEPYRVLVIACAEGENEMKDSAAFTPAECSAIERWVDAGGGLLLVTDHFPYGSAVESLGKKFGVEMSKGMTSDAIQYDRGGKDDTQLDFSRSNRLLDPHPIRDGRSEAERVGRVVTFTGQSVRGPKGSVLFLRHGATAVFRDPHPRVEKSGGDTRVVVEYGEEKPADGWGQGVALLHGRGRVVVLGEAGVLSAQLDGERKIGMNLKGNDDRQLALNILHWLSGLLPSL
jgi:hypothetical protein